MKIGIVGRGVVGSAIFRLFRDSAAHELCVYDKFVAELSDERCKEGINHCDLTFICVPTPTGADGLSCDISAVEECMEWINGPVCIRSTIPPGTVDTLAARTGKLIAFSPEYLGEQPGHPWCEDGACGFVVVGGPKSVCDLVTSAYRCMGPIATTYVTTARTAELCKYMENTFLALKVAFVNQFYDIAEVFGVDFLELRKIWLADSRVGTSHSSVTPARGFRGRCLPKDLAAIVAAVRPMGGAPLLEALLSYNTEICRVADSKTAKEVSVRSA